MKTAEEILKEAIDAHSQHDGSYTSYKHLEAEYKRILLESMEEYVQQFKQNQPVISEEEIKNVLINVGQLIAGWKGTTPSNEWSEWDEEVNQSVINLLLSLSSNDKQEKKPTEQIKVGDRVVVNSNCEDKTFFGKEGIVEDRYFELCKVRFENDQCRAYSEYKLNKVEKICPQTGDVCSYATEKCKDKCKLSKRFIKPL